MNLTPSQLATLRFIADYRTRHGCGPTLSEMGRTFGIASASVRDRVEDLIDRGMLLRVPGAVRGLSLAPGVVVPGTEMPRWSILGTVSEKGVVWA